MTVEIGAEAALFPEKGIAVAMFTNFISLLFLYKKNVDSAFLYYSQFMYLSERNFEIKNVYSASPHCSKTT
jgi:hypothetical protein